MGLWIRHKAPVLFPPGEPLDALGEALEEVDRLAAELSRQRREEGQGWPVPSPLERLHEAMRSLGARLELLAEHALTQDRARDPLTRLFTRRYLDPILTRETRVARRYRRSYLLLLADIDHFKRVNDTLGHQAGDRVLTEVARRLVSTVRDGDFVFRYGGEEFLLLLPDLWPRDAGAVADKLLEAVRAEPVALEGGGVLPVTISIGMAAYDGGVDYNRIIARADEALYRAKRDGRDRWRAAEGSG